MQNANDSVASSSKDVWGEMSADSTQLLGNLSKDYANYAKVYIGDERRGIEDVVDDLLTRLDEFMASVSLIRSDGILCLGQTLPQIHEKQKELETTFAKIDKLETFVSTVKECVNNMEEKVEEAERILAPENSIVKVLKPLSLFSKRAEPTEKKPPPQYAHPHIFNTSDYFPSKQSADQTDKPP